MTPLDLIEGGVSLTLDQRRLVSNWYDVAVFRLLLNGGPSYLGLFSLSVHMTLLPTSFESSPDCNH